MTVPETKNVQCRVLVLGAYGLIGSGIARRLTKDGFSVIGLGRNAATAHSVLPDIQWVIRDLTDLCDAASWGPVLSDVDMVVNCAGALQDGAHDHLDNVHLRAVEALSQACRSAEVGLVQISAVGARPDASTAFMRTKSAGDQAIRDAGIRHWIFHPGLVLAPTVYGGSMLLRMLAAVPLVQPLALQDSPIQTVSSRDVERVVSMALQGKIPAGTECDLVEDCPHTLREIVEAQRNWLGFRPARYDLIVPRWILGLTSSTADALGALGWRSPVRSAAMQVLSEGLTGDPKGLKALGIADLSCLNDTMRATHATVEDRLFARMALLMPLMISVLFIFWLTSGLVGLWKIREAALLLEGVGWPTALATASVMFWSFVDIAIAIFLLVRKYAAHACVAMVAVSLVYLVSATVTVPDLWSDPLGPLIKVLPGIVLALVVRAMLETR